MSFQNPVTFLLPVYNDTGASNDESVYLVNQPSMLYYNPHSNFTKRMSIINMTFSHLPSRDQIILHQTPKTKSPNQMIPLDDSNLNDFIQQHFTIIIASEITRQCVSNTMNTAGVSSVLTS